MTQATIQQVQSSDEEISNQIDSFVKSNKKTKATIYLTEEAERAFAELYIARYRKDRKVDRSTIACEAIQALYERECREKN
jgi:hypothetical protein